MAAWPFLLIFLCTRISSAGNSAYTTSLVAGSGATGSANGQGVSASFYFSATTTSTSQYNSHMDMGSDGLIYITDTNNHALRVLDPDTSTVSFFCGSSSGTSGYVEGACAGTQWRNPMGIATSSKTAGLLFVADTGK
jgi:serine/threonine-protein kinase